MTELTDATVEFGLIPHDHWYQPDWVDEEKASAVREQMMRNGVIYGGAYKNLGFLCAQAETWPVLLSGNLR